MSDRYEVDDDSVYRTDGPHRRHVGIVWQSPVHRPLWHVDWRRNCLFAPTRESAIDLLMALDTVSTMYDGWEPA